MHGGVEADGVGFLALPEAGFKATLFAKAVHNLINGAVKGVDCSAGH